MRKTWCVGLLGAWVLLGCSENSILECRSGDTRACFGAGACEGGQICEDGAWSECDCGAGTNGGNSDESCQVVASGDSPLIDDISDNDHLVPANDGRVGSWYTYNDGTGVQTPAPAGEVCDVNYTIEFADEQACTSGSGFSSWGAQLSLNLVNASTCGRKCKYDVSAYKGIRFTVSGASDRPLRFQVYTASVVAPQYGGDCVAGDDCYNGFGVGVPLAETPQTFSVRFSELRQETDWGLAVDWDPAEVLEFDWIFKPAYGADGSISDPLDFFELCIDDVEFF